MARLTKDLLMIVIGCLSYALALTLLAIPNNLAEGGVPGAAVILHFAFDVSPGIVTFILTTIVMIIGYKYLPKRALFFSILTVPLISFFIYSTENMVESLGDPLTSAIFAGVFIGAGSGLIFRTGSTMGGTSLIARMCHDKLGWDLVRTIFVLDMLIVLSGLAVIGPLNTMYTIITLFVAKKGTDLMIEGLDPRKAVSIISVKAPEIADEIIEKMNISVTVFKGYGGYLKEDTDMTYVIINKFQLMHLKNIISAMDENAFVVIYDVRDVLGGSFAWDETKKGGIK
ncbi:MAG TPA: YitT family protein [Bacillota bacterium]|nr:YitT family protein [Bacillota bacterium]